MGGSDNKLRDGDKSYLSVCNLSNLITLPEITRHIIDVLGGGGGGGGRGGRGGYCEACSLPSVVITSSQPRESCAAAIALA